METRLEKFSDGFDKAINEYSPLTLAFLGDAVYELFIRAHIVKNSNTSANMLHKKADQPLEDYLEEKVFAKAKSVVAQPTPEGMEGFAAYLKRYIAALDAEKSASQMQ